MRSFLVATIALGVLMLAGGPAAANGPPEGILAQDSLVDVNPCTGEIGAVRFDMVILFHVFDNEAGRRHHENSLSFAQVTTDDGYTGRSLGLDVDNGQGLFGEEEGTGMFQSVLNATLSNDAGQRIVVHFRLHINQVDGEVIAFVSDFSGRCAGKRT